MCFLQTHETCEESKRNRTWLAVGFVQTATESF